MNAPYRHLVAAALAIAAVLGIAGIHQAVPQIGPIPGMGPMLFQSHAAGCTTTPIPLTTTGTGGTSQLTNTTGCTNFKIEVLGPGGSGGGSGAASSNGNNCGGGGGGYSVKNTTALSGAGPWNYNIGAGGAAVSVGSADTNGNPGAADTWFCNATTNCASIAGTAVVAGAKLGAAGGAAAAVSPVPAALVEH